MIILILISILVFVLNIPFGYWRANVRRFSLQWVLAIHLPVPFIVAFRILSDIGFAWHTYVFLVTAYFLGQRLGSALMKRIHKRCRQDSSCMFMDLYRCRRSKFITTSFFLSLLALSPLQAAEIEVNITGFNDDGKASILLFSEGQKFDANSSDCIRRTIQVRDAKCSFHFSDLAAGTYAIMVYHDQNKNGKLDTNLIGMPREGVGTSNNYKGIPSFRKCRFELEKRKVVSIEMVYF